MAGQQQRHELVTDLAVTQPLAVLVLRQQQRREDVVALGQFGLAPPPRDLRVEDLVDGPFALLEVDRRAPVGSSAHRGGQHQQPPRTRQRLDHPPQPVAELVLGGPGLIAEDRAQDHAQRQRLHRRQQRERLAHRPGVDLVVGAVAHRLLVAEQPAAVERRQHQPPVAQVLGLVEQQHRALPEHRTEQRVRLTGVKLGR